MIGITRLVSRGPNVEVLDESHTVLRVLTGNSGPVRAVAYSPDGTTVATASTDGTARIWDVATGTTRTTLTGHTDLVYAVAYSPDGTTLATASNDGTVRIWEAATGTTRTTLTGHTSGVCAVAYAPDGITVVTAADDGTARIWDAATGELLATLIHLPGGGSAVLLPDGSYKLDGDPAGVLWWAVRLCRFEPGELDPYVGSLRRRPASAPLLAHYDR